LAELYILPSRHPRYSDSFSLLLRNPQNFPCSLQPLFPLEKCSPSECPSLPFPSYSFLGRLTSSPPPFVSLSGVSYFFLQRVPSNLRSLLYLSCCSLQVPFPSFKLLSDLPSDLLLALTEELRLPAPRSFSLFSWQ